MQMIFQDPYASLNPKMTVGQAIKAPLLIQGIYKKSQRSELEKKVEEMMDLVGLARRFVNSYPHELDGGRRQRIGIARALSLNPKFIVCDEPVSALDVSIQAQILNLLKELQKTYGLTYIFIAHGLPTVKHISDRIAVMYLGQIVELADKESLFAQPMHPYTEGLLEAIPLPDPDLRKQEESRDILKGDIPNALDPPSGCHFHPRCPYADETCRNTCPQLKELQPGHFAACHHPLERGMAGE